MLKRNSFLIGFLVFLLTPGEVECLPIRQGRGYVSCAIGRVAPILENLIYEGHYEEAIDYLDGERPSYFEGHHFFERVPIDRSIKYASTAFSKAKIYFYYLKDSKSALREIENALVLADNPGDHFSKSRILELKSDIEVEMGRQHEALADYSAALDPKTKGDLHNLSILWKRASVESALGMKEKAEDDKRAANTYIKEFSLTEPYRSYITASLNADELSKVLNLRNPFDCRNLNSMSLRRRPDWHLGRGDKEGGTDERGGEAYTVQVELENCGQAQMPIAAKKLVLGHGTVPSELYCFPWGFLQLVSSADGSKIEFAVLRTPYEQLCETESLTGAGSPYEENQVRIYSELYANSNQDQKIGSYYLSILNKLSRWKEALAVSEAGHDLLMQSGLLVNNGNYSEGLKRWEQNGGKNPTFNAAVLIEQNQFGMAKKLSHSSGFGKNVDECLSLLLKAKIKAGLKDYVGAAKLLNELLPMLYWEGRIKERDDALALLSQIKKKASGRRPGTDECSDPGLLIVNPSAKP